MSSLFPNELQLQLKDENSRAELQAQIEELRGLLRVSELTLKDTEFKFTKTVEAYEMSLYRLRDENKQMKDKYDKVFEAQRKLEKQNSTLEERLLSIVGKYEEEQKTLFEELTIAHSRLVETQLTVSELEKQKEAYRLDCNLAVSLLQCRPTGFVDHSYSSLPSNLKDRLKSMLSMEEMMKLESVSLKEENEKEAAVAASALKIPIFQPTAAVAMMYNMQNNSLQREKLKIKRQEDHHLQQQQQHQQQQQQQTQSLLAHEETTAASSSSSSTPPTATTPSSTLPMRLSRASDDNSRSDAFLSQRAVRAEANNVDVAGGGGGFNSAQARLNVSNEEISSATTDGRISSRLLGEMLKKEADKKANKAYKLLPYICLRCKRNIVLCDSPTQTDQAHDAADPSLRRLDTKPRSILSALELNNALVRANTVANSMSELANQPSRNTSNTAASAMLLDVPHKSHHQKCASTDFGHTKHL